MNSRLSALDRYAVVSNSDAHSAPKLGREASCFDTDLSFAAIYDALRSGDPSVSSAPSNSIPRRVNTTSTATTSAVSVARRDKRATRTASAMHAGAN
jgi:PHP family Zn ribbon phosphoesterase